MKTVTVAEFVKLHGPTPSLARGRWKSWDKPGCWELKGRNLHVRPLIWDEVSGTAWVQMPEGAGGQLMLVRVENLIRYKTALSNRIVGGNAKETGSKVRKTTSTKVQKKLPTTAEELLKALGM